MEMEPTKPPEVAKKLWKILRIVFFMLKDGISKSKLMVDFHWILKRGNKLAGKAIANLILLHHNHHHLSSSSSSSSFSCRSNDAHDLSIFISPKEYEFSCSNSPAFNYPFRNYYSSYKRKHHHYLLNKAAAKSYSYDDAATVQAVKRVLEMLNNNNNNDHVAEASPLTTLPGFGRSPMVRQLRITDSPFPMKDEGDSQQVDKAAEEFIKKFYKELKVQKSMAALESPSHNSWGRWM